MIWSGLISSTTTSEPSLVAEIAGKVWLFTLGAKGGGEAAGPA